MVWSVLKSNEFIRTVSKGRRKCLRFQISEARDYAVDAERLANRRTGNTWEVELHRECTSQKSNSPLFQ